MRGGAVTLTHPTSWTLVLTISERTSCYRRHHLPAAVIRQTVWLYFRFPLSLRDVEDMLPQRGNDVSFETVRR